MSSESDITGTVTAFFDLWQRQVALLARSPDIALHELLEKQKVIYEQLNIESGDAVNTDGKEAP